MSSDGWKIEKLGTIAEVQTGPFGSQLHQRDYVFAGTPIITVEHLGENYIMIEEASDGIFWAEKLGITESMSYFRNELIGLLSKKGELGLLARNYYENGKIADLEGRHDDAIRFLQQALVLAEKTGLVTIAMGSKVRLKSLLSEI